MRGEDLVNCSLLVMGNRAGSHERLAIVDLEGEGRKLRLVGRHGSHLVAISSVFLFELRWVHL